MREESWCTIEMVLTLRLKELQERIEVFAHEKDNVILGIIGSNIKETENALADVLKERKRRERRRLRY